MKWELQAKNVDKETNHHSGTLLLLFDATTFDCAAMISRFRLVTKTTTLNRLLDYL